MPLLQVYKFERLQPLSYYAAAEQSQPMGGLLWGARDGGGDALRARCQMVRQVHHLAYHTLVAMSGTHLDPLVSPRVSMTTFQCGGARFPESSRTKFCPQQMCCTGASSRHPSP